MDLPAGVSGHSVQTSRLRMRYIESGPADGVPIVMIHGTLSTGRFFEHLMPGAPREFRIIAPDMRGFGDTERLPIDATRGLGDWTDDTYSLVEQLGITRPVHLVGWSTGGAAIPRYANEHPTASLTLIGPVSPYGFGGVKLDGTPCNPDYAGSGGGTGNLDFMKRIADGDTSEESLSPRNVMNTSYWAASYRFPKEHEDMLVDEINKSVTGDDGYPGDSVPSQNWPGIAPGTRGIWNALSPKYCNWAGIVEIEPKPPILWTHGSADTVVADGSALEMGMLGKLGYVPGWPGDEAFPPQPMVSQIRNVLTEYQRRGGRVRMEMFEGSGHGPVVDAADRWSKLFFDFVATAEVPAAV
jgi:pimeloyl-ACP methyl ester carboxylesterase